MPALAEPETVLSALQTPWHIGAVTLVVHDLEAVTAFYRDVIGLEPLTGLPGETVLGAGGTPLLRLRRDPSARRRSPTEAGLFHTAFLLPGRAALAGWLRHAIERRVLIEGASDHLVSEAIYLSDPEGNGIEVYADRAREDWNWQGATVRMATERLDIQGLLREAGEPFRHLPAGSAIGHVHLQVGDLPLAESFYADLLGFDVTARYPGGTFYSTGRYHHHLATNIWHSRGALPRDLPSTGLAGFDLVAADVPTLDALHARLQAGAVPVTTDGDGVLIEDPWRNAIRLMAR